MERVPEWLRHTLRVRAVPVDRALVVRGAVGMLVPLALGQLAGRPDLGAAAGLGAYGAAVDDGSAPWRTRALTLLLPQLGGAIGLALGRATEGQAWAQILLVAVVALVSGLLSSIGRVSDMAGLVLLLATAMGLGLPTGPPWWQVPLLFLLGGLPLMFLSVGGALLRPGRAERRAVAGAVRAVARLLEATDGTRAERRRAVTAAMDAAHDAVLARRLSAPRPGSSAARLAECLDRLVGVIAAVPPARAEVPAARAACAGAVRGVAAAVEAGVEPQPVPPPPAPVDPGDRGLFAAVAELAAPYPEAGGTLRRVPVPAPPGRRFGAALAGRLRDPAARGQALRLAGCMAAAQAVASFSGLPRSGWLVLTVALVVRPGLGTVPGRLVPRALGTTAGVLIGLAAGALLAPGWWWIAALVVLTGLLQAYGRRTYAVQTLLLTPVMLLLADPLGRAGPAAAEARLLDTLIGCALAFALGHLLWPEDTRARIPHRLAGLHEAIAEYARHADPVVDHARRRIHRELAAVRAELERLRTDPRHRAALPGWWEELARAEAAMAGVRGERGSDD
ncbi:FUSC family protein [Streptomyces sp. TBY4]|uniref:FUSC family protein n=1 Tax=Streptomyces sp. TBY4 TaxID=2962030 RepID=UPI0020B75A56|nr:FUSC family protein [Streptomyces sp. TBY4]MCP3755245.1 FUSC family protein [Streptomyces sp. TBY4]